MTSNTNQYAQNVFGCRKQVLEPVNLCVWCPSNINMLNIKKIATGGIVNQSLYFITVEPETE